MNSTFNTKALYSAPIEFTAYHGSGSFKSFEVMSSPALICFSPKAALSHVVQNIDSKKASVTTSYRIGTVIFMRFPELSENAFGVLHRHDYDASHVKYGA